MSIDAERIRAVLAELPCLSEAQKLILEMEAELASLREELAEALDTRALMEHYSEGLLQQAEAKGRREASEEAAKEKSDA